MCQVVQVISAISHEVPTRIGGPQKPGALADVEPGRPDPRVGAGDDTFAEVDLAFAVAKNA